MNQHLLETYKSMIQIGVEASKAVVLLNGGAVVAMLAFLGQSRTTAEVIARSRAPLGWFLAGLVLGMLSFLFGYLTQYTLYREEHGSELRIDHRYWQWTTVTVLLLGVGAFGVGAVFAVGAIG